MAELKDLLVDRGKLDEELLAEVLLPLAGIDPGTQEIVPREGWKNLTPEGKILVVLLGRKAMCAMTEIDLDVESLAAKDVEKATGLKGGTLRPTLTRMKGKGLITQDKQKRYAVPVTAVLSAKEVLRRK